MSLFKKAACFSDIHLGLKHNSSIHNEDCVSFIEWFCNEAQLRGCETAIFCGDWHHHRNTINVSTLNYTHACLNILNETFNNVYMIIGNHDLYYRESRDVHSMPMTTLYPNITPISTVTVQDDVAFVPWLVGEEWKDVRNIDCKYMFGHFELPGFKLNAMVDMPDHGGLNRTHFKKQEYVFTGHFHKRQYWQNVHYIGNPFGHNYADAWDFDRGAMFLEWGGSPEYVNWDMGPKYMTTTLSKLVDRIDEHLVPNAHIKAMVDIDLTYEEINYMKETFVKQYGIRELILVPMPSTQHEDGITTESLFETVDEIVIDQLKNIDSEEINKAKLVEIYTNL